MKAEIKHILDLTAQLNAANAEIAQESQPIHVLEINSSAYSKNQHPLEHKRNPSRFDIKEIENYHAERKQLFSELKTRKDKVSRLTQEVEKLTAEIKKIKSGFTVVLSDISAHRQEIADIQADIEKHQDLMTQQDLLIQQASRQNGEKLQALLSEREQLLVENALGNGDPEKIEKLNQAIDKETAEQQAANVKQKKIIEQAHQTKNGLQKIINPLLGKKTELEKLTGSILHRYLAAQYENEYQAFLQKSSELSQITHNLKALERVIESIGEKPSGHISTSYWQIERLLKQPPVHFETIIEQIKSDLFL